MNYSAFQTPTYINGIHNHVLGTTKTVLFRSEAKTVTAVPFPTQRTLVPALEPEVELGLTWTYTVLYSVLFLMVYVQLWMIWIYRHKRFSYQTVFLYLALLWSGLRTTLFSFYFNDCRRVNILPVPLYWMLFCFPVCLQFIILCLLVLFFAQVVFKARAKYKPNKFNPAFIDMLRVEESVGWIIMSHLICIYAVFPLWRPLIFALAAAVICFLLTNVVCAVLEKHYENLSDTLPFDLLYVRVAINDSLFILLGVVLSICIFRLAKTSSASIVLEAKGTTMCQALTVCILIVLLYTSRAIYNLVAILPVSRNERLPGFGYGWINVTDQADFVKLNVGYAFLSFGIVLFVWEILPMSIVIIFFRVRKPGNAGGLRDLPDGQNTAAYFFDNPRRYDSDEEEDLSYQSETPRLFQPEVDNNYTINESPSAKITPQGTPNRPHRLGYGAVLQSDRIRGTSPSSLSPSRASYDQLINRIT